MAQNHPQRDRTFGQQLVLCPAALLSSTLPGNHMGGSSLSRKRVLHSNGAMVFVGVTVSELPENQQLDREIEYHLVIVSRKEVGWLSAH